jgi:hypothetical protein
MNIAEIEKRLATLEESVKELQAKAVNPWPSIIGHFANDPVYDEIVRLGKEYRDSQDTDRKKQRKPRKRSESRKS